MGSLYSDTPSWLHPVSAGLKLLLLALFGTTLFVLPSPWLLGGCTVLSLGLWWSLGAATRPARRLLWSVSIAALLVAAFHIYMGHYALAAVSAMRLLCASILGMALTVSTRPSDLVDVLERLLQPLRKLGLNPESMALQLALMLRFTEHFFVQWKKLDDAHRARTGRGGGLRLLAPLTIQMLQATRRVADALWVRLGR